MKDEDGLGFKDLRALNLSLLAKQCWQLSTQTHSLFYKVFRGKYFQNGDIMSATIGTNPSWAWWSLLEGRKVLEKGIKWKVGNGCNINVYEDPWLSNTYPFRIASTIQYNLDIVLVKQLMNEDGSWNVDLIDANFPQDVAMQIRKISPSGLEDKLRWCLNKGGRFTVASGYKMALAFYHPLWKPSRNS